MIIFGECKFDEIFGFKIWEIDFDLLMNENMLKDIIFKMMKQLLFLYEGRVKFNDFRVELFEEMFFVDDISRVKKCVDIIIDVIIKSINRNFDFKGYFFVGLLFYK